MVRQRKNYNNRTSRKSNNNRRIVRKRSRRNNPIGSAVGRIVASGAKTLLSSIPVVGDALKNLSDFVFKSVGLTSSYYQVGQKVEENPTITSLVARFEVKPSCILSGTHGCITVDRKTIYSQYIDARVLACTIRIMPSGAMKDRAGDWHLGIQPYFNNDDTTSLADGATAPTELGIHHMMYSASGPASKPLQITYRPRVVDGRAYLFNKLDSVFMMVAIRFDCYDRAKFSADFTVEQFSCDVKISGTVETRTCDASINGAHSFSDFIVDKNTAVDMFLEDCNGNSWTVGKIGEDKAIIKQSLRYDLDLDRLAIE